VVFLVKEGKVQSQRFKKGKGSGTCFGKRKKRVLLPRRFRIWGDLGGRNKQVYFTNQKGDVFLVMWSKAPTRQKGGGYDPYVLWGRREKKGGVRRLKTPKRRITFLTGGSGIPILSKYKGIDLQEKGEGKASHTRTVGANRLPKGTHLPTHGEKKR